MISIVNYGLGNVKAIFNIYKSLGIKCEICDNKNSLKNGKKIILPGVGSFDWAMNKLNQSGMRDELDKMVLEKKIPILGICVGMQLMASNSKEGKQKGLNWFDADNLHLSSIMNNQEKIPHMGWNQIQTNDSLIIKDIKNPIFYFLHSYFINPTNHDEIDAYANYGVRFPCAISNNENIFGVQFHPEKSHNCGIKVLENFAKIN